jgi:ADP-L-glycero-D-manno-heptose 6-epimerase
MGIEDIITVDTLHNPDKSKNLKGKIYRDYISSESLLKLLKENKLKNDADIIIHLGACTDTTETDSSYLLKNNYLYSKELGEWCLRNEKRYLYASSAATYGDGKLGYSDDDELVPSLVPLNEYGNSKQLFDLWVLDQSLQKEFVGFKFFNVFGPNEYHKDEMRSMVNKGYQQIKLTGKMRLFKSHKPEYKDGEQKRDFIYVKDALEVVQYFIEHSDKRGIYNVGTGHARAWNELANALFSALGQEAEIEYFDMPANLREQYQYFTQADITKLRDAGCDHRFNSLEDAVKDYVGYLEQGAYL